MDFYRKHKHTKGILTTKHDNHHDTQKALKLIQFKKRQATIIGCVPHNVLFDKSQNRINFTTDKNKSLDNICRAFSRIKLTAKQ